ncbi:MBL fold metallo-hydrolase [Pectinatus sottacetonis]|uniref:MBL fold metallo-hydrolase n=1 Tax=Pectinatus sottacetonis TaxID=1002795 RepID=UPI0018C64139|nr:MBL fold metallo-hydrolase [Pectinatus sottacetonis]
MELKITTLIENMPGKDNPLCYEHGFSLFIEFAGKKIIFDTGQTASYIKNAERLSIPLKKADILIVSHGHYDHSGGVMKTLGLLENKIKMYVGNEFFALKYKKMENATYRFNGINFTENDLKNNYVQLYKISDDMTFVSDKIILFKNFVPSNDFEKRNPKFMVKKGNDMLPDSFADEIVLGLITTKGLVVIAGCSHVGIVNILTNITARINVPVYAVLGGTHLVEADTNRIDKTIAAFRKMNIKYIAVSHCTGEAGIAAIRQNMKDQFILNNTGNVFSI